MIKTNLTLRKVSLLASAAPFAMLLSVPAFAQDATAATGDTQIGAPQGAKPLDSQQTDTAQNKDVVVTGTLFRNQSDTNIASPVSVITADDLDKRGVSTVQQAIQSLASSNGPSLTNSFSANGAFAGGASAVSLRGLSTNSTLTLFDGLRAAYYPLADDGSRNFVDLNTIPDEIVERVEVLRDGASSTYGADAVAGVINVITKKQITGVSGTAEAGITERGDAANQRLSLTAGYGDLDTQRFNVYVSGHYIHQAALYSRDRGYPYNTDNQSGVCYQGNCGVDGRQNSPTNFSGVSTIVPVFLVRPATGNNSAVIAGSRYQFLNPVTGCGNLSSYTLTAAQLTSTAGLTSPSTVCTQDTTQDGGVIEPNLTRLGASARGTVKIGDNATAYAEFNFEQSTVSYSGYGLAGTGLPTNSLIRANAAAGINYPRFSTSGVAGGANAPGSDILALPVYICPRTTVGVCTAANGTLNPNNPFAASGQVARIIGSLPDVSQFTATRSRAYRLAAGINGTFADSWDYRLDAVGMVTDLRRSFDGYVYIQHLLDEVKDGSYNFVNPAANTQAVRDYLAPHYDAYDNSELYQANASLTHAFFQLPGGPLQVGIGGSVRYEAIYAPSANDDINGPTQRFFGINAFGTVGHRTVESGYFQVNAPIFNQLSLEGSGRYDNYSSGQSNFSPKGGVVFTPIRQLSFHGTISGGFRIPSFAETTALPTTGYVPLVLSTLPAAYLAQYSNSATAICTAATPANCSSYLTTSTGEQSIANANLKPEKSRNITVGGEFKPIRGLSFTADYYEIRKTNAITAAPYSAAINAYYAGTAIPAGYTIVANTPDVNHPTAKPTLSVVGAPFINANTIETSGVDVGMTARLHFGSFTFTSQGEATYIIKLNTTFPDGHVERYAGTLGNFNLTAGTGTPRWKATWQNTVEKGPFSLSATAYYTSGYNLSAEDQEGPDTAGDCGLSSGIQACDVKSFIDVDMTGQVKVNDRFTLYVNVLNVADAKPPLDTVTYGGYLYNPVVAESGIVGRAFRAGARVKF